MKIEAPGSLAPYVMYGELTNLTQGSDRLILPAMWRRNVYVAFSQIVIFCLTLPANVHSYTFFVSGVAIAGGAVTVSTSLRYSRTRVNFAIKGQTDYLMIRHDTNTQDGDEMSGAHVSEGTRIFAAAIPERIGL